MSIDARVVGVSFESVVGGAGHLILEDRPGGRGEADGIKGQSRLYFDSAPPWVAELIDRDVWGGSCGVMFGGQEIAVRKGYTRIVFTASSLHGLGPKEAKAKGL